MVEYCRGTIQDVVDVCRQQAWTAALHPGSGGLGAGEPDIQIN
jgi:hypothetical protein